MYNKARSRSRDRLVVPKEQEILHRMNLTYYETHPKHLAVSILTARVESSTQNSLVSIILSDQIMMSPHIHTQQPKGGGETAASLGGPVRQPNLFSVRATKSIPHQFALPISC